MKHIRNVFDEQVVVQFAENVYYQYFCGLGAFSKSAPCASSELVHIRHRIGKECMELILKESIRINLALEDRKREKDNRKNGKDDHKTYSLHGQDVLCICKGKVHKKYELGNKVSIIRLWSGVIIVRNEYDGHTIDRSKEQARRLYGRTIRILAGDRGYRGQKKSGYTMVMIPDVLKASDSAYMKARMHELFRKRAGIEPVIGLCKRDHRLGRNSYKGLFGDSINVMLAAAAYNLKRAIRRLGGLVRWGHHESHYRGDMHCWQM